MSIHSPHLNVRPVRAFSDNYIWLIESPRAQGRLVAVDPGDAAPVIAELQRSGASLAAILLTHHHPDHIGGVPELLRHNFDEIFIELDPVKRENMMRDTYTEDCVWIHPGGRLVGIAAINKAASEIRKSIPEYRYAVIGDIQTMHNVGMCRWGSGLPGQPYRYTGTDVLEARDGRVAVFYTFIDSGTPPVTTVE